MTTATAEPQGHYERRIVIVRIVREWRPITGEAMLAIANAWIPTPRYFSYRQRVRKFVRAHPADYRFVKDATGEDEGCYVS